MIPPWLAGLLPDRRPSVRESSDALRANKRRNPCQFQLTLPGYHMYEKTRIRQSGPNRLKCGSRLVHPALELNAVPEPCTLPLPLACQALAKGRTLPPSTARNEPSLHPG